MDIEIPKQIKQRTDVFNAVHLQIDTEIQSAVFFPFLMNLLNLSKENNGLVNPEDETTAIWVHLSSANFHLIEKLVNEFSFQMHHGLGKQVVLNKWIGSLSSLIPPYSMFYIACGAVILRDDKIFLVQEKSGGRKGKYGIPGGRADFGECIPECAERQLFEETGIKAKYSYLLYFRELEKSLFNGVDIYCVCMMEYDDNTLDNLQICERELSNHKWVPLDEYAEFAEKACCGTQNQIAKYIDKLHKRGFRFREEKVNNTLEKDCSKENQKRKYLDHILINKIND